MPSPRWQQFAGVDGRCQIVACGSDHGGQTISAFASQIRIAVSGSNLLIEFGDPLLKHLLAVGRVGGILEVADLLLEIAAPCGQIAVDPHKVCAVSLESFSLDADLDDRRRIAAQVSGIPPHSDARDPALPCSLGNAWAVSAGGSGRELGQRRDSR